MVKQVLQTIEKYKLLEPKDKVLVAVSGGPDSVCLLWILNEIKKTYFGQGQALSLRVAHLNHCLREEADEEAKFVKKMASKLGIPCTIGKRDVLKYIRLRRTHKLSLEEGAREVRYAFLEEVSNKFGMNKIATGHTLNDEVETLILRIARGTGLKGLSLIPPKSGKIIRPLIEVEKNEILKFLKTKKIPYKVDKSNYDLTYPRNFVRHKIIPLLTELAPDFSKKVMRLREISENDESLLELITQETLKKIIDVHSENRSATDREFILDLKEFLKCKLPMRRRILRKIVENLTRKSLSFEQTEKILDYINNSSLGSIFSLPAARGEPRLRREVKIEKSYNELIVTRIDTKKNTEEHGEIKFPVPGEIKVNGIKIKSKINPAHNLCAGQKSKINYQQSPANRVYFDFSKLKLPLFVRSRKEGDKFYGHGYTKKLKDVFIDDKIPLRERLRIPLLVDRKGILWIIGKRRTGRALVKEDTNQILEVWTERVKSEKFKE